MSRSNTYEPAVWAGWLHLTGNLQDLSSVNDSDSVSECELTGAEDWVLLPVWRKIFSEYRDITKPGIGEAGIRWCGRDVEVLMQDVRAVAPVGKSFTAQWRVSQILEHGNGIRRWDIPIPKLVAPLPEEEGSPFQHVEFVRMAAFETLTDRFLETLRRPGNSGDGGLYWGRLFASAAFFGGLLQARWLWALPQALAHATSDCVALELYEVTADGSKPRHWRWFPDPVTRHLLVRAWRDDERPPAPGIRRNGTNIYRLIERYCRAVDIAEGLPPNWRRLLRVLRCRLSVDVPPFLVRHATGTCSSASLPHRIYQRSRAPEPTIRIDPATRKGAGEGEAGTTDEGGKENEEGTLWPRDLRGLASAIRTTDPVDVDVINRWINQRRAQGSDDLLPSVARLAEWVAEWLCAGHQSSKRPRRRTVYAHFNAIGARLVGQLGTTDPAELEEPEDFRELYANALEDTVSAATRKRVARGLRSFHEFLVFHHGVPEEGGDEIQAAPGNGRKALPNANYIDPISFERSMTWIACHHELQQEEVRLTQLIAVLGYYAGLRRSEAAGLLVADLEKSPDYDLVIRPNADRKLKSASANRVLPLRPLLPRWALGQLLRWRRRRLRDARDRDDPGSTLLLAVPEKESLRNRDRQFDFVTQALAEVTGDASIRFHQLRHSFASRWVVLSWEAENGHMRNNRHVPWIIGPEADTVASVRKAVLGDAPVQRRSLLLVARLMGHSDAQITVEHYIHSLDELLGRAVRRTVEHLSDTVISGITGRVRSQVRAARGETDDGTSSATLEILTDRRLPRADQPFGTSETDAWDRQALDEELRIECPSNAYEHWALFAEAVNAHASGSGQGYVQVAYPWGERELQAAAAAAGKLGRRIRKRRSRTAPEPLIDPPRTPAEKALARKVLVALHGDSTNAAYFSEHVRKTLLDAFRIGCQPGLLVTVRFEGLPEAKHWAALLTHVGIREEFEARHIPARTSDTAGPVRQRRYWEKTGFVVKPADGAVLERFREPRGDRGAIVVGPYTSQAHGRHIRLYGLLWALAISCIWLTANAGSGVSRRFQYCPHISFNPLLTTDTSASNPVE